MEDTPVLYVTMGMPASGKTYFAERFASDQSVFFLNIDSLRMAMIEQPQFTLDEHRMVYGTALFIAEQHIKQGKSIICNGNYNQIASRQQMKQLADRYGVRLRILWSDVPYEVAKQRILSREHEIPKEKEKDPWIDVLNRMSKNLQPPTDAEPFVKIDGQQSYEQQREYAMRRLAELDSAVSSMAV